MLSNLIKNIKVAIAATRAEKTLIATYNPNKWFNKSTNYYISTAFKKAKKEANESGICPICGETTTEPMQSIHKRGHEKMEIVATVLTAASNDYDIAEEMVDTYHKENAVIAVGCKDCHKKYDSKDPEVFTDIADEHFKTLNEYNKK